MCGQPAECTHCVRRLRDGKGSVPTLIVTSLSLYRYFAVLWASLLFGSRVRCSGSVFNRPSFLHKFLALLYHIYSFSQVISLHHGEPEKLGVM